MDCLICGKKRHRDYDLCLECLHLTSPKSDGRICVYGNCAKKAIEKLDLCGTHLIETIYGICPPFCPVNCNVDGCTEKAIGELPVCEEHLIIAHRTCISALDGNAKATQRVSKLYKRTSDEILREYIPQQCVQQERTIHNAKECDSIRQKTQEKHEHLCRCGKPADPMGNKCKECFAEYNRLKFGVGRGTCQCGAQLGEKGTMCQQCFSRYKQMKFGTRQIQMAPDVFVSPTLQSPLKKMYSKYQVMYPMYPMYPTPQYNQDHFGFAAPISPERVLDEKQPSVN